MNTDPQFDHKSYKLAIKIMWAFSEYRFSCQTEDILQTAIAEVLTAKGIDFQREYIASANDRFDFYLDGVVIEVKIKGSKNDALRQISRYLLRDDVTAVVLVGSPRWIGSLPDDLHGKRIHQHRLIGSLI